MNQKLLGGVSRYSLLAMLIGGMVGCGGGSVGRKQSDFFTSGSREADQRASQKMAQVQQLAGTGDKAQENVDASELPARQEGKSTLFDRLGGTPGISNIVVDFLPRAMQDPRINWERKGVTDGGLFRRNKPVAWDSNPANVARLENHLVQFLSLATGGPTDYDGKDMKSSHAGLHITNTEFDAAIGDLKASLDRLRIRDREQKELLAIIESTRPQVVTER